jgi:hypothetical protein
MALENSAPGGGDRRESDLELFLEPPAHAQLTPSSINTSIDVAEKVALITE